MRRQCQSQQDIKLISLLKVGTSAVPGRADLPVISRNKCIRLTFDNTNLNLAEIDMYASSVCQASELRTSALKHTLPRVESGLNGPFRSGLIAAGSLCKGMPLSRCKEGFDYSHLSHTMVERVGRPNFHLGLQILSGAWRATPLETCELVGYILAPKFSAEPSSPGACP